MKSFLIDHGEKPDSVRSVVSSVCIEGSIVDICVDCDVYGWLIEGSLNAI